MPLSAKVGRFFECIAEKTGLPVYKTVSQITCCATSMASANWFTNVALHPGAYDVKASVVMGVASAAVLGTAILGNSMARMGESISNYFSRHGYEKERRTIDGEFL